MLQDLAGAAVRPVTHPRARASDGVDLVEEDDARLLRPGHGEQLPHHARALAHVLLHELGSDDADEARVRAVGHGTSRQRLASAGGAGSWMRHNSHSSSRREPRQRTACCPPRGCGGGPLTRRAARPWAGRCPGSRSARGAAAAAPPPHAASPVHRPHRPPAPIQPCMRTPPVDP